MTNRLNIAAAEPGAMKALIHFTHYLDNTTLPPLQKELIRIRASQINGCSYCMDKHTRDARKLGETEQRLYLVSAWRETDLFTEEERCILAMTEEITLISQHGLSDDTYAQALRLFDEQYVAQVIMSIIGINALNRVGVSTRMKPAAETR